MGGGELLSSASFLILLTIWSFKGLDSHQGTIRHVDVEVEDVHDSACSFGQECLALFAVFAQLGRIVAEFACVKIDNTSIFVTNTDGHIWQNIYVA